MFPKKLSGTESGLVCAGPSLSRDSGPDAVCGVPASTANVPFVARKLATLNDVGLSYVRLGQNATTLDSVALIGFVIVGFGILQSASSGAQKFLRAMAACYEMEGVSEDVARDAFRLAASKLPFKTQFVTRSAM